MVKTVVQDALNGLLRDLQATHGDNLASVVLYGSAAAGDHVELRSDYNLLITLNRITPDDLRLAQAPMREWQRLGHPLPVYFTTEELADAADVFPIEFHQMANARVVLYGRDPFEFIKLSDANLRHQTEYELRSKLIQLRRMYIPASVSVEKLCDLMSDSLVSFVASMASGCGYNTLTSKHENVKAKWANVEAQLQRRADLLNNLIETAKLAGVQEQEVFGKIAEARSKLLNATQQTPQGEGGDKTPEQKQAVIDAANSFGGTVGRL